MTTPELPLTPEWVGRLVSEGQVSVNDWRRLIVEVTDYGAACAAAERDACAKVCEAISDEYGDREGQKWPEMKSDAQMGSRDCEYAIRARGKP